MNRINRDAQNALGDADVRSRFAAEGASAIGGSAATFATFLKADYEKWGRVVKRAGIKSE